MKLAKIFLTIGSIIISSQSFAEDTNLSIDKSDLYGSWECSVSTELEGTKTTVDVVTNYVRNGRANSQGMMTLLLPDFPKLEYSIAASGSWMLEDGYLIETSDDYKLTNLTNPLFDEIFSLESLIPQNISESSKILSLNENILTLKSESDGSIYSCNKVISNTNTAATSGTETKITTAFGDIKIKSTPNIGIYSTQIFELNGKVVGESEWLGVDGQLIGMDGNYNYVVLRGYNAGSACSEILSIVRLNENKFEFSPSLNACGGVDNVDFKNGKVTVSAFERDGSNVEYIVDGNKIYENGKSMLVKHSFLKS